MPELKRGEAKFLQGCAQVFLDAFERDVAGVLRRELRGIEPASVRELREELTLLMRQLDSRRVHHAHLPLIRRVLVDGRRTAAAAIETPLAKVIDPEVAKALHRGLLSYEGMLKSPWLEGVPDARIPRLTDFLSIRFAEEAADGGSKFVAPRIYDEKFHILEAPALALPDLEYYRRRCQLRQASVGLAYADIDDFKAINTRLTETIVDAKVLPPFMELIETWSFARGHAYRFGGDEYVLLLPNAGREMCLALLGELLTKVSSAVFAGVRLGLTIGLCVVDPDCFLTDREVLMRANEAKQAAKAAAKGAIAVSGPPDYGPPEIIDSSANGVRKA